MEELVKLSNLFAQDRIFSRVNIPQLNADLQALKQVIPGNKANRKERQDFIEQLFKTWNKAFFLTPKIADLSIEKIVNLSIEKKMQEIDKHYFYINHLILDCQKVAVNISPTVWQEIEDRMLRVP
jgi:hypothetical protein